jgi:hypothetical protein
MYLLQHHFINRDLSVKTSVQIGGVVVKALCIFFTTPLLAQSTNNGI